MNILANKLNLSTYVMYYTVVAYNYNYSAVCKPFTFSSTRSNPEAFVSRELFHFLVLIQLSYYIDYSVPYIIMKSIMLNTK